MRSLPTDNRLIASREDREVILGEPPPPSCLEPVFPEIQSRFGQNGALLEVVQLAYVTILSTRAWS